MSPWDPRCCHAWGPPGPPPPPSAPRTGAGGGGPRRPGGGLGAPLGTLGVPRGSSRGVAQLATGTAPPPTPGRGVFPVGPLGVLPPGQGCSSWGEGAPPGPLVGVLPVGQGFFPPPPPPQGEGAPCGSPGRGAPHGAVGGGALPAAGVLPPGPSVGVLPVARGCTPRGRGAIPRVTWWGCCPWNGGAGGVGSPGCLDPLAGLGGQQTGGGSGEAPEA